MTEPTPLAPCPGCGRADRAGAWTSRSFAALVSMRCDCGWHAPSAGTADGARAEWNRRAPPLRWRSEPPDVAGNYWIRGTHRQARIWSLSAAEVAELREVISRRGNHDHHEWAGPIPEPEEGGK